MTRTSSRVIIFAFVAIVSFCPSPRNQVDAYSTGAPSTACETMTPGHGVSSSSDPCPFETLLNQNVIFSNGSLTITINSKDTTQFKGFLVMGFAQTNGQIVGTFQIPSDYPFGQTLDCSNEYENAATHKINDLKSSVAMEWIPPSGFDGVVQFKTTYVKDLSTYWVQQLSQNITVIRSENVASTTTVDPPTGTNPPLPDVYAGCGSPGTKGCIATPNGCIEWKNCSMMTTYRKVDDHLELEIYGQITSDEYVAVGFSSNDKMGTDSVVECVQYRNELGAYVSYNTPTRNNQRLATNDSLQGFELILSTFSDGYIYCQVQHPIQYEINNEPFDLSKPNHVLMAVGSTGKSNIQQHREKMSSSSPIDIANDLSTSYFGVESRTLKQLHGSFMVFAWLIAASIGVFMPRYMKKTWVGKQFMKKDLWFVYHRALMVLVWTLTVAGFIIIFVDVGGWVPEPISENPHPLIGCITTALAFIQPFMAMLRPAPTAPNRYIFNWAHLLVGYSAHTLAITCIFLAVEMEAANLPYHTYWILTTHICCYAITQLLLTYLARRNSILALREFGRNMPKSENPRDERGSLGRQLILAAYSCIVLGLGITIVVFIALS